MKSALFALFALFLTTTAHTHTGHERLSFSGGKIQAHLSWEQGPVTRGESKMRLEWRDGSTHALINPGQPFAVVLWMPSMGHGSAPTKIQPALDGKGQPILGTYIVSNMQFLMAGDWDIRVTLGNKSESSETQAWSIIL